MLIHIYASRCNVTSASSFDSWEIDIKFLKNGGKVFIYRQHSSLKQIQVDEIDDKYNTVNENRFSKTI